MIDIKKHLSSQHGKIVLLFLGLFVLFLVIIHLMKKPKLKKVAYEMQTNKKEVIGRDLHYTTQETLSTLIGEADNLKRTIESLNTEIGSLKIEIKKNQSTIAQVESEAKKSNKAEVLLKKQLQQKMSNKKPKSKDSYSGYQLGSGSSASEEIVWVNDALIYSSDPTKVNKETNLARGKAFPASGNDLNPKSFKKSEKKDKTTITPMYTIPKNSWLTSVIPEQPLVGIIPVNGQVMNPRTVSFAVGSENLAAKNWHLPAILQGIQGDAVCMGFFAVKRPAVTCNVTSLTFIYEDGTINTIDSKNDDPLGVLTDLYGNPQIGGKLYSNLGYFLGGSALFAGLQGYGNALSTAQMQTTTAGNTVPGVSSLIGNANTFAQGQSLSAAAKNANNWWSQRMKSTFDYVEVQNWDEDTHELLQLNVKITKSIPLDYDEQGRNVDYANAKFKEFSSNLD